MRARRGLRGDVDLSADEGSQKTTFAPLWGGGEIGDFIRTRDWSTAPAGELHAWPLRLRQTVQQLLSSGHPTLLLWGPRLLCFYNAAFRQCLGPEKHPRMIGQPFRTAFPEWSTTLEPEFAGILAGEGAVWRENRQIPIHRHGILTDAWWTYSASPVESDEGVAGILVLAQETTGAVRREALITAEDLNLRLALDSGRIGSWTLDLTSWTLDASHSCKINFGRSPHAAFSFEDMRGAIHAADRERMDGALARAIERGEDYDIEYRVTRSDGRETWILVRGRAAYDPSGAPLTMSGISMDITGRKHAEEHLRLMVDELNHRVKNTLATVQSVSRQTLRNGDVGAAVRDTLDSRLLALSRAHDVLTDEQWSGADLQPIVRQACEPFGGIARFDLSGPSVRLTPRIAIALALAFHELCTNATKYGALSTPKGHVSVGWRFRTEGAVPELEIVWREHDGPPVTPPTRRGFGSRLIQRSLVSELNGRAQIDYLPDGVVCALGVGLTQAMLQAKGTRLIVGRDGDSWTVGDAEEILQWFETQADAIAYLTEQLNALRVQGRSGTVIFQTTGDSDPPQRRRGRRLRS